MFLSKCFLLFILLFLLSMIFNPISFLSCNCYIFLWSYFNRSIRDSIHLAGLFHTTVFNIYWYMLIFVYLFYYIRCFDHFHKHCLLKTIISVLILIFLEFLFSRYLENITQFFHGIHLKICLFISPINGLNMLFQSITGDYYSQ